MNKFLTPQVVAFACYSATCRPPTSGGTGGSSTTVNRAGALQSSARKSVAATYINVDDAISLGKGAPHRVFLSSPGPTRTSIRIASINPETGKIATKVFQHNDAVTRVGIYSDSASQQLISNMARSREKRLHDSSVGYFG